MVLSSSSDSTGLLEEIDFMCGTPDDFTPNHKKREINEAQKFAQSVILSGMDKWEFLGEEATASLVADQREYTFPTTLLQIRRIDAKLDGTNWVNLLRMDHTQMRGKALSLEADITALFGNTQDLAFYDPFDRSFKIYSGTITSVTNGLKIYYTDSVVTLSSNGDVSAIDPLFHRVLTLIPSIRWASKHGKTDKVAIWKAELGENIPGTSMYTGLLGQMQRFYANREKSSPPVLRGRVEDME